MAIFGKGNISQMRKISELREKLRMLSGQQKSRSLITEILEERTSTGQTLLGITSESDIWRNKFTKADADMYHMVTAKDHQFQLDLVDQLRSDRKLEQAESEKVIAGLQSYLTKTTRTIENLQRLNTDLGQRVKEQGEEKNRIQEEKDAAEAAMAHLGHSLHCVKGTNRALQRKIPRLHRIIRNGRELHTASIRISEEVKANLDRTICERDQHITRISELEDEVRSSNQKLREAEDGLRSHTASHANRVAELTRLGEEETSRIISCLGRVMMAIIPQREKLVAEGSLIPLEIARIIINASPQHTISGTTKPPWYLKLRYHDSTSDVSALDDHFRMDLRAAAIRQNHGKILSDL